MRVRDHDKEELSFYSKATSDIEFLFPFGWGELWGIADRTDYDLTQHQNVSGQDLTYFDDTTKRRGLSTLSYLRYRQTPFIQLSYAHVCNVSNNLIQLGWYEILPISRYKGISYRFMPICLCSCLMSYTICFELISHCKCTKSFSYYCVFRIKNAKNMVFVF